MSEIISVFKSKPWCYKLKFFLSVFCNVLLCSKHTNFCGYHLARDLAKQYITPVNITENLLAVRDREPALALSEEYPNISSLNITSASTITLGCSMCMPASSSEIRSSVRNIHRVTSYHMESIISH